MFLTLDGCQLHRAAAGNGLQFALFVQFHGNFRVLHGNGLCGVKNRPGNGNIVAEVSRVIKDIVAVHVKEAFTRKLQQQGQRLVQDFRFRAVQLQLDFLAAVFSLRYGHGFVAYKSLRLVSQGA